MLTLQVQVAWGSALINLTSIVEAVTVSDRMMANTSNPGVVVMAAHCSMAVFDSGKIVATLATQAQEALATYLPLEAAGQRRRLQNFRRVNPSISAFLDPRVTSSFSKFVFHGTSLKGCAKAVF
jgi:hypothetical protein